MTHTLRVYMAEALPAWLAWFSHFLAPPVDLCGCVLCVRVWFVFMLSTHRRVLGFFSRVLFVDELTTHHWEMPSDIRRCYRGISVEATHTHIHTHRHEQQGEDNILFCPFFINIFISRMKFDWDIFLFSLDRWNDDLTHSLSRSPALLPHKFRIIEWNISKESVTHRMCLCIQRVAVLFHQNVYQYWVGRSYWGGRRGYEHKFTSPSDPQKWTFPI